jgi:hypothetical protein
MYDIVILFYKYKILGIFKKNLSGAFISFDYCPFCGKRYDNNKNTKSIRIILNRDKSTMEADFLKGIEHTAFIAANGIVYLQDEYGEKIYLKPRDYKEA